MMRSRPSQLLRLVSAGAVILGLAACVEPADSGNSSDTLAPLVISGVDSTTSSTASDGVTVPLGSAAAPPAQTAVLDAGSVSTATTAVAQPTDTATTVPATTVPPTSTTVVSGPGSYTIAASDTMFSIARRCASSASELATFNGWADGANHLIRPGDVIKLPCTPGSGTATASTTPASGGTVATTTTVKGGATSTTVAVITGGSYTIVAGDYLAGIAVRAGTTMDAIVAANGWPNAGHALYPGDVIKLPAKQ